MPIFSICMGLDDEQECQINLGVLDTEWITFELINKSEKLGVELSESGIAELIDCLLLIQKRMRE